jgi:glycosyltransferase involved in cell wall biosynthesis
MRICLIYQGEFPPAERITKIAKTLTAAGHKIFLVCNNYGRFDRREEQVGDVYTIRVGPVIRNRKASKIVKFPVFLNPLWITELWSVVRRFRIDALQVIDIPLSVAALWVGRAAGIPVLMDMWENYPEALRGWAALDWKTKLFKNPDVARQVELWVTRRVDHIFTVVDEQKDRLIADGVQRDRISVVTNGVDLEMLMAEGIRTDTLMDAEPEAYKLLYVGFLTVERGLDDIVRALPHLRARIPSIRLYLAGQGSYEPQLRALVEREGVADLVRFTGWVRFEEIQSYILKSDLCIVPHVYNTFINTTIPNKLFQYMALSKPILVSNAKPLARIVGDCQCGWVFRSGDPVDAATAIEKAYLARKDAEVGERGRRCAMSKYTWDKAAEDLLRVYDEWGQQRARSHAVARV